MAEFPEWERELLDPEYGLVKAKERYEAAVSVLDDLVRSHMNSGYRHAARFVYDLERQGKAVATELRSMQSAMDAVDHGNGMPHIQNPLCSDVLRKQGKEYPRTCPVHGLWNPCN